MLIPEEELIIDLIKYAFSDATGRAGPRQAVDALAFFHGGWYRHWTTFLGVEPSIKDKALGNERTLKRLIPMILTDKAGEYYERKKDYKIT